MIEALTITPPAERKQEIRRPRQERSRQRVEAILDAAERLLERLEPADISIYTLAEEAGISAPSIYHFFPDASQVFLALSERIQGLFVDRLARQPLGPFTSWQELLGARFGEARDYYNTHPAARRLLLGSGLSATIRARDLDVDRQLAMHSIEDFRRHFHMPDQPELVERFTELLVINDAMWTLSVHRHDCITDAYDEQARRAREAYTRTFLPEYLLPRDRASQAA
ncbi:TetR/AcrR family transcriptional regulator [Novosphingobium cyanobacteriorum]|uniref:TetR/AcrR family transcriptional regulator n=1 Tax=Novosphingobium cyanobacteriorum TaxID=3024215 RepID=A0ABT6CPV9_9SPHN|nr:TetR/AcrR family transcriptional regulator [Novosphingobium cyanobacteriorum]MDF8334352.1 TetR/AcrR family transcriptional regulator [Novosphingobium cyanobacteriorum]